MTAAFWLCLHFAGYAALATVVPAQAVRFVLGHQTAKRLTSAARRTERIAKLELQLGIGLDYGREWLLSCPIACKEAHEHTLAADGNGAVPRTCWGCDTLYRPHDEYPIGSDLSWYGAGKDPEVRQLVDRLCRSCYDGATRRDFGVADFVSAGDE